MKRYIPSENVIKRKYDKVVESNIKLVDEIRYLKVDIEKLNQDLINEKNAYNSMYNMYTEKEQEIERLHSIIKEVREYANKYNDKIQKDILEILDKENKE